ncbi:MAG: hypothetical protein RBR82_15910 [Pseudomonas sp.]|nr:hypothetical protein [Pseudomonas sp.]
MSEVLKPCPFCGEDGEKVRKPAIRLPFLGWSRVRCSYWGCGARYTYFSQREWNTRAPDPNNIDAKKERIAKEIAEAAGLTSKSTSP